MGFIMEQQVYLIKNSYGHYKIGVSGRPDRRLKEIINSSGLHAVIIQVYSPTQSPALLIEKNLHTKFFKNRLYGEWFEFKDDNIAEIFLNSCYFYDENATKDSAMSRVELRYDEKRPASLDTKLGQRKLQITNSLISFDFHRDNFRHYYYINELQKESLTKYRKTNKALFQTVVKNLGDSGYYISESFKDYVFYSSSGFWNDQDRSYHIYPIIPQELVPHLKQIYDRKYDNERLYYFPKY